MGAVPCLSDFQYTILSGDVQCIFYIGYDGKKEYRLSVQMGRNGKRGIK